MRHKKNFNHLGRKSEHRKAMLSNMANSLILHKRITTTLAKAKALRTYIEPLITKAKNDSTHSRRLVFSYLQNKEAVSELFREISQKVAERPGGYTRILKTGTRLGDNADMCIIELVDYNELLLEQKEEKGRSARRRRGTRKKEAASSKVKAEEPTAVAESVDEAQEETVSDVPDESTGEVTAAAEAPEVKEAVPDVTDETAENEPEKEA